MVRTENIQQIFQTLRTDTTSSVTTLSIKLVLVCFMHSIKFRSKEFLINFILIIFRETNGFENF